MSLLLEPLFLLLLVSPLFFLGKKTESSSRTALIAFLIYFWLDAFLVRLPIEVEGLAFLSLNMNWEGKIFSYLGAIGYLFLFGRNSLKEFGLTLEQESGSGQFSKRTLVVFFGLVCAYGFMIGGYDPSLENMLFQLTMPSIVEEIVYRGIMLGLLNQVFARNFKMGTVQFGMGLVITSLLFGMWHGLSLGDDFSVSFALPSFLITGALGFFLGLVRERTGSILYPTILHIMINFIPCVIGAIMP